MLLLVILLRWVCFSPSTMATFQRHRCWLLIFFLGFPHFPWVLPLIQIAAYIRTTLLSDHIVAIYPPWKPDSGLVLCSGDDAVDGNWYCSNTTPISPLLASGSPHIKICPGSLYDGATLIAPEGGNNRGVWRPPCCGHWWSVCCPCCNFLAKEAYYGSIFPDGQKYREWKAITKVWPSSRGNSGLPPGRGYRSAPEVTRSAKVHLQVQWLWIPCWLLYFDVSPSFLLTY